MLYLGPERRHYIDVLNLQVNKNMAYFSQLPQNLNSERQSGRDGLQSVSTASDNLRVWDEQLVEYGSLIITERSKTVHYFNQNLQKYYQKLQIVKMSRM